MGTIETSRPAALLAALVIAWLPQNAVADDAARWYASAVVGAGTLRSETLTYSDGTASGSEDGSYDVSFAGGGTLGYRLSNRWSLEGEIMYRSNDVDPVNLPGLGSVTGGDFASLGIGINALYRYDFGVPGEWSVYIGPGLVYLEEIDIDLEIGGDEISFETDEIAFQLKFGVQYDFSRRWYVEAGAAFVAASSVTMKSPADSTQTVNSDYYHLTLTGALGLRF